MQHLEDLEDILDMDTATRGETHFRDYREIQAEFSIYNTNGEEF